MFVACNLRVPPAVMPAGASCAALPLLNIGTGTSAGSFSITPRGPFSLAAAATFGFGQRRCPPWCSRRARVAWSYERAYIS